MSQSQPHSVAASEPAATNSEQGFVPRPDVMKEIEDIAKSLLKNDKSKPRVAIISGQRGSGKTRLCFHLKREFLPKINPDFRIVLVGLYRPPNDYPIQPNEESDEWFPPLDQPRLVELIPSKRDFFLEEIIKFMVGTMKGKIWPDSTLDELVQSLGSALSKDKRPVAFILDSAFEADGELMKLLEEHLLVLLATHDHVMLVITGRGKPKNEFNSPYFRNDVIKIDLKPFEITQIVEQTRLEPDLAEKVLEAGGGQPMCNEGLMHVAEELCIWFDDSKVLSDDQKSKIANEIQSLRKEIKTIIDPGVSLELRDSLRFIDEQANLYGEHEFGRLLDQIFEAICSLELFRESHLKEMIPIRFHPYLDPHDRLVLPLLKALVQTQLVKWDRKTFPVGEGELDDSGYFIDVSIRSLSRTWLRLKEPDVWRNLNCKAKEIYEGNANTWAKSPEPNQAIVKRYFDQLVLHHGQICLQTREDNP